MSARILVSDSDSSESRCSTSSDMAAYRRSGADITSSVNSHPTPPVSNYSFVSANNMQLTNKPTSHCTMTLSLSRPLLSHGLVDPLCGTSWDKWNWDKLHRGYRACPGTRKGLQRGYMPCPMGQGEVSFDLSKSRSCLSIFIYGETSKQFRVYGQTVYEETSKIKAKTLSCNQRQGNQIAYYTKTPGWISSKLTPADASRSCTSFCI